MFKKISVAWDFKVQLISLWFKQIEDGEIYASINQKDGMVCFHDNPEKYNNPAMLHKIDQEVSTSFWAMNVLLDPVGLFLISTDSVSSAQMLKCIELDEKLKSMDQEITVNPQFVQKVRRRLFLSICFHFHWFVECGTIPFIQVC